MQEICESILARFCLHHVPFCHNNKPRETIYIYIYIYCFIISFSFQRITSFVIHKQKHIDAHWVVEYIFILIRKDNNK